MRPTTTMTSPAARVSTQAGGSHTVTGTDVARSSAAAPVGQRTARLARRVPDSRTRISAGPEHGPQSTARFTPGDSTGSADSAFTRDDLVLVDGIDFLRWKGPATGPGSTGKSGGEAGTTLRRGCDTH